MGTGGISMTCEACGNFFTNGVNALLPAKNYFCPHCGNVQKSLTVKLCEVLGCTEPEILNEVKRLKENQK